MENFGITLVIPCFNRADLILATIQSAFDQTQPFQEIIVVDDCSTDDTLAVLEPYQERITIIASEKVGVQMARNKGVAASRSPYITLCDSDDLLQPDYVEIVTAWLARHPECDTLYVNFQTFSGTQVDPEKFGKAPKGYFDGAMRDGAFLHGIPGLYGKLIVFQPLFPTGLTTKKTFYEAIGGFDPTFNGVGAEDWEYTLRAVDRGNTAVCIKVLARLRRHASNDSNNQIRMSSGEITVLEHALIHHPSAQKYRAEILSSIDERRLNIFQLAFGKRLFGIAADVLPLIRTKPKSVKFRIKQAIMFARYPLRSLGFRAIVESGVRGDA